MLKNFSYSCAIVITIFCAFVAMRQGWYFLGDDFSTAYIGKRGCQRGLAQFWGDFSNDQSICPSNVVRKSSFLSVMFRPLTQIFYTLQFYFFGNESAWPYFLVAIFLHAIAAIMLFWLLLNWFEASLAFLISICFGCYPLMGRFVGRLSVNSSSICLIFVLACSFLYLKYLKTNNRFMPLLASALFLVGLLFNEILLPMPLLFFLPVIFSDWPSGNRWRAFYFFMGLNFAAMIYLGLRLYFYPVNFTDNALAGAATTTLKERFFYWLTILTDTFVLTSFPEGNKIIKSLGVLFFGSILSAGFFRSRYKKILVGLFFGFCIACWPAIVFYHAHRYLYFSTPLFLVALAICLESLVSKVVTKIIFTTLICMGIFECNRSLSAFESQALQSTKIAKTLATYMEKNQNALCLALMPMEIFPGWSSAQAVWLYTATELPIFYDPRLNTQSNTNNNVYSKTPDENLFNLESSNQTIEISCLQPEISWLCSQQSKIAFGVGEISDFEYEANNRFKYLKLKVSSQFLRKPLALACWNEKQHQIDFKAVN